MLLHTSKAFEDVFSKNSGKSEEGNGPVPAINLDTVFKQLRVSYRWSSIVVDQQHTDKPEQSSQVVPAYLPDEDKELRAGDRAPDAPDLQILSASAANSEVGNDEKVTTSLFNIFHPARHTLLLFSESSQAAQDHLKEVVAALAVYPLARETFRIVVILPFSASSSTARFVGGTTSTVVLVDVNNHAHTAYHLIGDTRSRMVVVRPDGVIGAILQDGGDMNVEDSKSKGDVGEGLKRYLKEVFRTA